jgi:hypothetical protein
MKTFLSQSAILCGAVALLAGFSASATAQTLFFDDFEDRVRDQAVVGNNWTWYDQTFPGETCADEDTPVGFGPYDDNDPSDYEVANRNYWTASEEYAGQGDSYFRAGLEVPAWPDAEGNPVLMSNMLRVYGNPEMTATTCERVLVFQEMTIENAGPFEFSFDVAQDKEGAPANGEITAAFVKVLRSSDQSYETVLFERVETTPPPATSPTDVRAISQFIEFKISEEWVGELLQFGFYNDVTEDLGQSPWTSAALYDNVMLAPLDIGPAHSGSWYNDQQSGHGFSIEFGIGNAGNPRGVVYWYIYDDEGNPMFMSGAGRPEGNRLEIDEVKFVSPYGMQFGTFDPDSVQRANGGTVVFEFSSREEGTFSYTPSQFSIDTWGHTAIENLPIVKIFGIPADRYFSTTE